MASDRHHIWHTNDFMSNINCGIGVLHAKRQRILCDVISLFARVFIVSVDRPYTEVYANKYWAFSMVQVVW